MGKDQLEKKIRRLPETLEKEALNYIDYLIAKDEIATTSKTGFSFDWEEGLSDLKDRFTSVELQHEATKWR